jgi:hypothetical protein
MKFCFNRTLKQKATWLWVGRLISVSGTKSLLFCRASVQVMGLIQPRFKWVYCVWNVMAHAQKPDFVFRRNGRVHLNRRGRQLSRLLATEVCASAVVMLDVPCSEVVWRVLATHSIRQFPRHFPSRASPCAITFQLDSTLNSGVYSRRVEPTTHLHVMPRLRISGVCTFPPTIYLHDVHRDNSLPCVLI